MEMNFSSWALRPLQHLMNQARDLLKAGEAKSLTEAQFKIARLYGFPSWPKLKAYVDLVNKDERTREERFRRIRMHELLKQDAEMKLEALRQAPGATLTQTQEASLKEELSHRAQEIEEELRRPGNKVMATSETRGRELVKDELAKLTHIPMHQAIQIATALNARSAMQLLLPSCTRIITDPRAFQIVPSLAPAAHRRATRCIRVSNVVSRFQGSSGCQIKS